MPPRIIRKPSSTAPAAAAAAQSAADLAEKLFDLDAAAASSEAAEQLPLETDVGITSVLQQLGEAGQGGNVFVFRVSRMGERAGAYVREYSPSEFSLATLRENHGGGFYRLRVHNSLGHIVKNDTIEIEKGPATPPPPNPQDSINQLAGLMMQGFEKMTAALAVKPVPAVDPMAQLTSVIAAISPLIRSAVPTPPPPVPERDPMTMLLQLLQIKKELDGSGAAEGADPTTAIVLKAMDTFGGPMAQMMAASQSKGQDHAQLQNPAYQAQPALPAPLPASPTGLIPASSAAPSDAGFVDQEASDMSLKITIIKSVILPMAASNADPAPYAEVVLDYFGDDEVAKYIEAPDWRDQLEKLLPEAAHHRAWFQRLRDQVIELLKGGDSGDVASS